MINSRLGLGALVAANVLFTTGAVHAAPKLRVQVTQRGDFLLIGNTLGHDCAATVPPPVVGSVGPCGTNTPDTAIDVYWRSDAPQDGQARADNTWTVADARTTSVLELPADASVTHAYLYWSATRSAPGTDPLVTLERPGVFTADVDAGDLCYMSTSNSYQCGADVTALVQENASGAYRVGGVEIQPVVNVNDNIPFAGWWMVVLYQLPSDPLRNLAVFDGLDRVAMASPQNTMLDGFLVPNAGFEGKLGLVGYEGDTALIDDRFLFDGVALSDALNPANNFFNGTRSTLGLPVSPVGDLPQLTGAPGSMSGMDLDIVNITSTLSAGQTSAPIQATSSGDTYFLAGFITSISDFRPDFTTATKTAVDVNEGSLLPGDVVEYTIHLVNTGNDAALGVTLTDPLPTGVTFVPGSLNVTAGPNMGAKTDESGDDQAEYDDATRTVTFRLGTGATAAAGGKLAVNATTDVTFQVTIDADTLGAIENQAVINASGEKGAPAIDTATDGNGEEMGAPPTVILVDQCDSDAECTDPDKPSCKSDLDPNLCVQCLDDSQCPGGQPTCDPGTGACACVTSDPEVCDGLDNDCNDAIDDGFNVGDACSVGVGECAADGVLACVADGSASECDAIASEPQAEVCDGLDNDCDGEVDNDCTACEDTDCGTDPTASTLTGDTADPLTTSLPTEASAGEDSNSDSQGSNSDSSNLPTEANPTASGSTSDSGGSSGEDTAGIDDGGCSCDAPGNNPGGLVLLGLGGLLTATRRRRRS